MKIFKLIRNELFKLSHQGKSCTCLYCGNSYSRFMHAGVKSPAFKKFKVSGGGYKKNVRCPSCHSGSRSRLLGLFFEHRTDLFKVNKKVLHISPNRQLANLLKEKVKGQYHVGALNVSQFLPYDPISLDIQNLQFEDKSYDVVICNHVLEHVPEDDKAISEIFRVLRPGGFAVLQVPLALNLKVTMEDSNVVTKQDRKRIYGQEDHVRLYGLDYLDRLESAGFTVEQDHPKNNGWLSDNELKTHCLDDLESVTVCRKLE